MKKFIVKSNCRLKEFTDATYPQGSFCLAVLLRDRDVKVNGVRVKEDVELAAGDEVIYYTTLKQEGVPSHKTAYEDENIYIADKFSGVSSEGLLSELCQKGKFYAVHRLDRNTQGLLVFAKNTAAEEELSAAFKQKRVVKTYLALCKNNFTADGGILTAYLVKDEKTAFVKIFDREVTGSEKIITEYRVLEKRGDIALVRITLHTGKTHQIRAHTAHIGCPVLGDEKYGDRLLNKKYKVMRQCLVSKTLALAFTFEGNLSYLNGRAFVSSFTPETRN